MDLDSTTAEDALAAHGLRITIEVYSRKLERAVASIALLVAELAVLEAAMERGAPSSTCQADEPVEDASAGPCPGSVSLRRNPAARTRRRGDRPGRLPRGELMAKVEQVLVGVGRPLTVKDITEALGRPARGKEGRGPLATVRVACKRLVSKGCVVEGPVGWFAVARVGACPSEGVRGRHLTMVR